jgi:hypothetical protein
VDFPATQKGEQHFRITDIIDITGENIAVENDEIGLFAEAEGTRIPGAPGRFGSKVV